MSHGSRQRGDRGVEATVSSGLWSRARCTRQPFAGPAMAVLVGETTGGLAWRAALV